MSTVTDDIKSVLLAIRQGTADSAAAAIIESIPAKDLMDEIKSHFPLIVQVRDQGRKFEMGLARRADYTLGFNTIANSLFQSVRLIPRLHRCVLLSGYGQSISEITCCSRIDIRPIRSNGRGLKLRFGKGFKFDKTVDGWAVKELRRRWVLMPEELLKKQGWQFDVLPPFGQTSGRLRP